MRTYKIWFKILYWCHNKIAGFCRICPPKHANRLSLGRLVINREVSKSFVAILTTLFERKSFLKKKEFKEKKSAYSVYAYIVNINKEK